MTTKTAATALLAVLAACSSVSDYEMTVRSSADLNPNQSMQPGMVMTKVLLLKGPEAVAAFQGTDFSALWSEPATPLKAGLHSVLERDVRPNTDRLEIELAKVPQDVTHVGVLALFDRPVPGKDRVVFECARADEVEVWLHGSVLELRDPNQPAPK